MPQPRQNQRPKPLSVNLKPIVSAAGGAWLIAAGEGGAAQKSQAAQNVGPTPFAALGEGGAHDCGSSREASPKPSRRSARAASVVGLEDREGLI